MMSQPTPLSTLRAAVFGGLLLFAVSGTAMAQAPAKPLTEMSGRDVMQEVSDRHTMDVEYQEQTMVLIDSNGGETVRKLRQYGRKNPQDGQSRYLLTFDEPAGVKGVALLTWEKEGDDDQWTFLPAMGPTLKRVAAGGRRNYFMGTDFAFEDMVGEDLDSFTYTRQPDEEIAGQPVFVVDAVPASADVATGYDRRRVYVRQDNFIAVKVDYFALRTGKHIKTMTVEELEQAEGGRWRPKRTLMDNLEAKHQTRTIVTHRSFAEDAVPEQVFAHQYIKTRRHMR